jgi:hypothetical protein
MTNIGVIIGRFQPAHLGHRKLFLRALGENKNGAYVALAKAIVVDKSKNPLDTKTQEELIANLTNINVLEVGAGSIPDIIYEILEPAESLYLGDNQYKFTFYCGTDRYQGYKMQAKNPEYMQDVIDTLEEEHDFSIDKILVDVKLTEREEGTPLDESEIDYSHPPADVEIAMYSASKVRAAIAAGNDKLAKRMMGLEDNDILYKKVERQVIKGMKQKEMQEQIERILEELE